MMIEELDHVGEEEIETAARTIYAGNGEAQSPYWRERHANGTFDAGTKYTRRTGLWIGGKNREVRRSLTDEVAGEDVPSALPESPATPPAEKLVWEAKRKPKLTLVDGGAESSTPSPEMSLFFEEGS